MRGSILGRDIKQKLEHDLGKLLTTINGVGAQTAVYLIAELGDPARFHSAAALASYVGVAPRLRQSGKRRFSGTAVIRLRNARLRKALWMPVLTAVRFNPGCELTMIVWFHGESLEKWHSSQRCESCSQRCGALPFIDDPSFRTFLRSARRICVDQVLREPQASDQRIQPSSIALKVPPPISTQRINPWISGRRPTA